MNNAEYLCHSSGPWKKHKYFQKIGEGANAVYKYARKNITGEYYKDLAEKRKKQVDEDIQKIWRDTHISKETGHELQGASEDWQAGPNTRGVDQFHHDWDEWQRAQEKYNKTPVARGRKLIEDLFKKNK